MYDVTKSDCRRLDEVGDVLRAGQGVDVPADATCGGVQVGIRECRHDSGPHARGCDGGQIEASRDPQANAPLGVGEVIACEGCEEEGDSGGESLHDSGDSAVAEHEGAAVQEGRLVDAVMQGGVGWDGFERGRIPRADAADDRDVEAVEAV